MNHAHLQYRSFDFHISLTRRCLGDESDDQLYPFALVRAGESFGFMHWQL